MADALSAHEVALSFSGGRPGILNIDALQSAIGRPYSGYHRSIVHKATALTESVVKNHSFTDGNKRTAIILTHVLLLRSGYQLRRAGNKTGVGAQFEHLVLGVSANVLVADDVLAWFRLRIAKL